MAITTFSVYAYLTNGNRIPIKSDLEIDDARRELQAITADLNEKLAAGQRTWFIDATMDTSVNVASIAYLRIA